MDLKHYRLIKTITEEGSIANSSDKLFLTQSALSHQLREMEDRLGFKVFYRKRNKWTLTKEGKELYNISTSLFKTIDDGFNNIKTLKENEKNTIRIETECSSFYLGLPIFIEKTAIFYPEIEVDIIMDSSHQPLSKLISKDIDFAIVTKKPSSNTLSYIELNDDEVYCLMHKEHHLAKNDYLNPDDFLDLHLLIHGYPLESVSVYECFLKPNNVIPKKITAISFVSVLLEMIEANLGVLCMPKWVFKKSIVSDKIVFKKLGENGLKRTHYLAFRTEDKSKMHIADFIDNITEEYNK